MNYYNPNRKYNAERIKTKVILFSDINLSNEYESFTNNIVFSLKDFLRPIIGP